MLLLHPSATGLPRGSGRAEAACWGTEWKVLHVLNMTLAWLLMNPVSDCLQEASQHTQDKTPVGQSWGHALCLRAPCTAQPCVGCPVPHLWGRQATLLDFLRISPCRKGCWLPPFLHHCAKQVGTWVATLHAVRAAVLKELDRDGRAKAGSLYLALNQWATVRMRKDGSSSLLRTDLGVCIAALSHVTMSSLFQQWPVSTGCKTALHEALGIIKINFQLPKQITRLNAFSFPLFWAVFVPLLGEVTWSFRTVFPTLLKFGVTWSEELEITSAVSAWLHPQ